MSHRQRGWQKNTINRVQGIAYGLCVVVFVTMYVYLLFASRVLGLVTNRSFHYVLDHLVPLSLYTKVVDSGLSQTLFSLHRIKESYRAGRDVFDEHRSDIDRIISFVQTARDTRQFDFFALDDSVVEFLNDMVMLRPDIERLLGADGPKRYLVLLQNSSEKRPNGGFFGSFAFVEIDQGRLIHLRVIDSYFPNWLNPDTVITAPEWTRPFIADGRIGFIASNKFGFTDKDGANIKNLFDHIFAGATLDQKSRVLDQSLLSVVFDKKIDGVLFVHSDHIASLLPGLQSKLWERQFVNAASSLIKQQESGLTGQVFSNKKSLYLAEVEDFFLANRTALFRAVIDNAASLLEKGFVQIFIDDELMTPGLDELLTKRNLATVYQSGFVYSRDTNDSENKIDTFITKKITITDSQGDVVAMSDEDSIALDGIASLGSGYYDIKIRRRLDIPSWYTDYITDLERKFAIGLTQREKGILALGPTRSHDTGEERRWSTRSQLYLPHGMHVLDVVGDVRRWSLFEAPFAHGVLWHAVISNPGDEIGVNIRVRIEK